MYFYPEVMQLTEEITKMNLFVVFLLFPVKENC